MGGWCVLVISRIGQRPPPGQRLRSEIQKSKTDPGAPDHDYVKCIMSNRRSPMGRTQGQALGPRGPHSAAPPLPGSTPQPGRGRPCVGHDRPAEPGS